MLNTKRLVSSSEKIIFHMQIFIRLVASSSTHPIGARKLSRKQVSNTLIQAKLLSNIVHFHLLQINQLLHFNPWFSFSQIRIPIHISHHRLSMQSNAFSQTFPLRGYLEPSTAASNILPGLQAFQFFFPHQGKIK